MQGLFLCLEILSSTTGNVFQLVKKQLYAAHCLVQSRVL
ncbi:hypothetical protein GTHT12_03650 [Geobacillus thermodenitrificans]|jgi:hypothetical protein|nr:hypothetical protein GTHT12_03650 [Geobacillus thermodenitrificans]